MIDDECQVPGCENVAEFKVNGEDRCIDHAGSAVAEDPIENAARPLKED